MQPFSATDVLMHIGNMENQSLEYETTVKEYRIMISSSRIGVASETKEE